MDKQIFFADVTFNFNLRQPNSNKATNIYLVAYINGKQIKLSTDVKVYSEQWNKDKQEAYISFRLTALDNSNNMIVNKRLNEIRVLINEFKTYICNNPNLINNAKEILKKYIYKEKVGNKSAIALLLSAFDKAYPNSNTGTYHTNQYRLRQYIKYVRNNNIADTIDSILSQDAIDKYKYYLINRGENGVKNINDRCEIIKRLINYILAVNSDYKCYNIKKIDYTKIKDKRKKEDTKKTPLTNEELKALIELNLTGKEREVRDVFVMQCLCGMRIGDMGRVFRAKVNLTNNDEEEVIITTQKENVDAVITFNKQMKDILRMYVDGFKHINIDKVHNIIDKELKIIAKQANLKRKIQWKEQIGNTIIQKEKPLHEIISSHFARHTFITSKILEGWQPSKLCFATGHTDDKMIRQIYTHLTVENKINIVKEEKDRVKFARLEDKD